MDHGDHEYLYDAFISYRRSDGAIIASWLRRRLQEYILPTKIAQGRKKLRIYLDTAFERANEDFWANNIEPALRNSRYLVVVATPATLRRRADGEQNWVEREIEVFLNLPQGRNILAVRAKGEFDGELPARLMQRFPQITIVDVREFSRLIDGFHIRSSLREHILTILGTLHNIESQEMPELRMEDAHNARRAATRLAATALALFLLISGLAIAAMIQRNAARDERNVAQSEAKRADNNAGEAKREAKLAEDNAQEAKRQASIAVTNEQAAKNQQSIAEQNARTARRNAAQARARELAAYATASLEQDPERGLLLAVEAVNSTGKLGQPPVPAAENALHDAMFYSLARLTFRGHSGHVNSVAFNADGKRVATGGADRTVKIWDAATGRILLTLGPFPSDVNALAFSPDGTRLLTGSQVNVALADDGSLKITGSPDDTAKLWDARTGQQTMNFKGSGSRVTAVGFSRDGKRIATGDVQQTTRVWDATTGREL